MRWCGAAHGIMPVPWPSCGNSSSPPSGWASISAVPAASACQLEPPRPRGRLLFQGALACWPCSFWPGCSVLSRPRCASPCVLPRLCSGCRPPRCRAWVPRLLSCGRLRGQDGVPRTAARRPAPRSLRLPRPLCARLCCSSPAWGFVRRAQPTARRDVLMSRRATSMCHRGRVGQARCMRASRVGLDGPCLPACLLNRAPRARAPLPGNAAASRPRPLSPNKTRVLRALHVAARPPQKPPVVCIPCHATFRGTVGTGSQRVARLAWLAPIS